MAIMCGGSWNWNPIDDGYWEYTVGNRKVAPGDPGYDGLTTAIIHGVPIKREWVGSGPPIIFKISGQTSGSGLVGSL
ncbi:MAG: hypothetical protein QMC80_02500 [Thermoplasmatales archaeon]|nr:hypothetical protein [Thermoplasmatales archaeon]